MEAKHLGHPRPLGVGHRSREIQDPGQVYRRRGCCRVCRRRCPRRAGVGVAARGNGPVLRGHQASAIECFVRGMTLESVRISTWSLARDIFRARCSSLKFAEDDKREPNGFTCGGRKILCSQTVVIGRSFIRLCVLYNYAARFLRSLFTRSSQHFGPLNTEYC